MTDVPARLHVLFAARPPTALVFRRGPSNQVALLRWQRNRDEFTLGQWLKGRIYERRSHLSPDGRYLIYFAATHRAHTESGGVYTAISRAPYLKALALFPKEGAWHGGGLWTGPRTYWLNDGYGHGKLIDTPKVRRDRSWTPEFDFGGECPGVYFPRLELEGWSALERGDDWPEFELELPHGWRLRKRLRTSSGKVKGRGVYWDEHELLPPRSERSIAGHDWEWAHRDRTRLVWAKGGALHAAPLGPEGPGLETVLKDFNDMRFERRVAPY